MKVTLSSFQQATNINIATRCPHCKHYGTFESLSIVDICKITNTRTGFITHNYLGVRKCPNEECKGHLFFISDASGKIIMTSPSETIPFEKENIPEKILLAFEEAIICHSNSCFIAAAILIRKTIEEICMDRGAEGKNLKEKLVKLGKEILIPNELLIGMDELRILGNDAAHIDARTYNEIGKDEIEVSLEFTKEILKAVYQYESLLQKLKNLKSKAINNS